LPGDKTVTNEDQLKKIATNFDLFRKLCQTKLGDRSGVVLSMLDKIGTRLAMTPASSRTQYHAAWAGGLVEHSLNVCKLALKLNEVYGGKCSQESLVISSLFHDLGKVGDLEQDLYLDQDSDWHRERGEVYKLNYDIQKMPTSHRSVYLLQAFGIRLSEDEWIAIMLNDGQYFEGNSYYSMHEPTLALIVHHADRMACDSEKNPG
jgi:hypothetical protein